MTEQMDTSAASSHVHEHGSPDRPMRHRSVVFGHETVFMSHLPMFSMPEHAYQVVLEVELTLGGNHKQFIYQMDRRDHPEVAFYTFDPLPFVLPDILPTVDHDAAATSFIGDLYRNHVEKQDPLPVKIADGETVIIKNVIDGHRLDVGAPSSPELQYLLFGRGEEAYLVHLLTRAPDFDQIVQVQVPTALSADALNRGVLVTVNGRRNTDSERIGATGAVAVTVESGSAATSLTLDPITEVYFNNDADMR
jgi:hypothetical protein